MTVWGAELSILWPGIAFAIKQHLSWDICFLCYTGMHRNGDPVKTSEWGIQERGRNKDLSTHAQRKKRRVVGV